MAQPNESSTLSGNGQTTASPAAKRKTASRQPAAKRPTAPRSGPTEILFAEEPNPFHPPIPPYIWIDYPQPGERLLNRGYVVRLGVGGAETVQISIDKEPWLPCRLTSGYWWYDWSGYGRGKHTLAARMRAGDGRWFKTPPRICEYRGG